MEKSLSSGHIHGGKLHDTHRAEKSNYNLLLTVILGLFTSILDVILILC
jgi:hypothetical protein